MRLLQTLEMIRDWLTQPQSPSLPYLAFQRRKGVFKGFPDKPALPIRKVIELVHRLRRGPDVELCRAASSVAAGFTSGWG